MALPKIKFNFQTPGAKAKKRGPLPADINIVNKIRALSLKYHRRQSEIVNELLIYSLALLENSETK